MPLESRSGPPPRRAGHVAVAALSAALMACSTAVPVAFVDAQPADTLLPGRWDLVIGEPDGRRVPSWLEVSRSGSRHLVGRFVHDGGSARPVARVRSDGTTFRFSLPPQWESDTLDLTFEGRRIGADSLAGTMTTARGIRLPFAGRRAPALDRQPPAAWTDPEPLLVPDSLDGWRPLGRNSRWRMEGDVLVNEASGANLATRELFTDFVLHAEVRVPPRGNSGIYLRGRHEVQVEDSHGHGVSPVGMGAIYGFLAPNEDATRPAGEWQSLDITLVGRRVTVVLNGRTIICDQVIPGITGGALDSDEGAPGPIYLQGDHGPIAYRNLTIRRPLR